MPTGKQLGLKDFSPKSQDAVALQQIKERGAYLWLIVVISVRQSTGSNIWASLPGAGYGQFEHKADSLIAKFKEAGGTVREIVKVWAESPRLFRLSRIIVCLSWAVNHYRDNAIAYKAQRDKKSPENWSWRTRHYWHADASAWCVAALDAKYTKELADAKAENDALRDDVAAIVVGCTSAVCQSVREATIASGVDNVFPRLADTAERDYFTLRREADHYAKTTGGTQKYINVRCR